MIIERRMRLNIFFIGLLMGVNGEREKGEGEIEREKEGEKRERGKEKGEKKGRNYLLNNTLIAKQYISNNYP